MNLNYELCSILPTSCGRRLLPIVDSPLVGCLDGRNILIRWENLGTLHFTVITALIDGTREQSI